jgi:hypothetical protein
VAIRSLRSTDADMHRAAHAIALPARKSRILYALAGDTMRQVGLRPHPGVTSPPALNNFKTSMRRNNWFFDFAINIVS